MGDFLKELGFSGGALILLTSILTPLGGYLAKLMKQTLQEMKDAKNDIKEHKEEIDRNIVAMRAEQRELSAKVTNQKAEFVMEQNRILDAFKERIKEDVRVLNEDNKAQIMRLHGTVGETKSSLNGVMDRMTSAMGIYEEKLHALEERLNKKLITREQYHRDLSSIKDEFYKDLHDIQKKLIGVHTIVENIPELSEATRKLITLNKKLLEYEQKFINHEAKLDKYEKMIETQQETIRKHEEMNVTRHKVTKELVSATLADAKKQAQDTKETVMSAISNTEIKVHKKIDDIDKQHRDNVSKNKKTLQALAQKSDSIEKKQKELEQKTDKTAESVKIVANAAKNKKLSDNKPEKESFGKIINKKR